MTRANAVNEAAVFGVVGSILFSLGGIFSSFLLSRLDFWVAIIISLPLWLVFMYFGMKQFAHGIYTLIEDVQT